MATIVRWTSFLVALVALVGAGPAAAASKKQPKRPDLTVSAVTPAASTASVGGNLAIATTVRNPGKATARASVVRAYLALDTRRRGARALTGSRAVGKLKPRKTSTGRATFAVPAAVPQGVYFLFACADADRKVRESKETNNCRSAGPITVAAQTPPPELGLGGVAGAGSTATSGDGSGGGDTGGGGPTNQPAEDDDRDDDGTPNAQDCAPDNGAIRPGAADRPDGSSTDSNCDGKDGDASDAIYVRDSTGNDNGTCGTSAQPCRTIGFGIDRATAEARDQVYVGPGTYTGGIDLDVPVSIYGGWDTNWSRSLNARPTVSGITDMIVGSRLESVGILIEAPAEVADINVTAPNASGTASGGLGKSSYGALVRNVAGGSVTLRRMNITAGNGTAGLDGADTTDPTGTPLTSYNGQPGQNAGLSTGSGDPVCNSEFSQGGAPGTRGATASGGGGGRGGREDRDCGTPQENLNPEGGVRGFDGVGPFFGPGGNGGPPCTPGTDGTPGTVTDGSPGPAGGQGGQADNTQRLWAGRSGSAGTLGQDGGSGGGGGGAGACEVSNGAFHGAGGGGGGVGGPRNTGPAPFNSGAGGGAGRGGGGSFAVYIVDTAVAVDTLLLTRGVGGNGGAGGDGGTGFLGGIGGAGGGDGPDIDSARVVGGKGGNGGRGGHSGPGGGGAGGSSIGIYLATGASAVSGTPSATITGGGAGSGGAGGAGDAPVANAQAGAAGGHALQAQCATPAAC